MPAFRQNHLTPPPPAKRRWWFGAVASLLVIGGGVVWFQPDWLPAPIKSGLNQTLSGFSPVDFFSGPQALYNPASGTGQTTARTTYQQALKAYQNGQYQTAVDSFRSLESAYPGLGDLILLHQAEAMTALPREDAAQKQLNALLEKYPDSPLKALALYRLAQSHLRASQWGAAQDRFLEVQSAYPGSSYAEGSDYYLGELLLRYASENSTDTAAFQQAVNRWLRYLQKNPNGRFSLDIANRTHQILGQTLTLTLKPEEYGYIGAALAASGTVGPDLAQVAIAYLEKAPIEQHWYWLGKAKIQLGKSKQDKMLRVEGIQEWLEGMARPTVLQPDLWFEALDGIYRELKGLGYDDNHIIGVYQTLLQKGVTVGEDALLWKLSMMNPSARQTYYQQIVSRYPNSQYAAECSFGLFWPKLNADPQGFLTAATNHVARYSYTQSAPKALFWVGKLYERYGQKSKAMKAYQTVLSNYPQSYYAFRAYGRTKALTGSGDIGWKTSYNQQYPPSSAQAAVTLTSLLSPKDSLKPKVEELEAIGALDDIALLLQEDRGNVPAQLVSLQKRQQGDVAGSIRWIRDYIDMQARFGYQPKTEDLKLLYPVRFEAAIDEYAQKNRLDPFIVQSLMREESYFNETAVSTSNALGLMQLLPPTAKEVAGWERLMSFDAMQLFQPTVNIQLGTAYLGYLHRQFSEYSMPAVGAYNGGPNAMKRWVTENNQAYQADPDLFVEQIPYDQTRDYIKKVFGSYWNYCRLYSG